LFEKSRINENFKINIYKEKDGKEEFEKNYGSLENLKQII
jgi:hypothetical protein